MVNTVYFDPIAGGDGSTVTDDDNATTGLGNGGHLLRIVPMMQQLVNVAKYVIQVATTALGGATTNATSTTSLAVGTGSKTLTLDSAGKGYVIGQFILLASSAIPSNYMIGQVTAFSGTSLTINSTVIGGSGTFASWTVSVTGKPPAADLVNLASAHAIALYF